MKKLFGFLAVMLLIVGTAKADLFDFTKSKEYTIHFSSASSAAFSGTTNYILIDLSNTASFPHKETGEIHITDVYINVDKAAATTAAVRLGVVNFVNASTGSVTWFNRYMNLVNVSNTPGSIVQQFQDTGLNTKVVPSSTVNTDGSTKYILSNDKTSGSTDFQNDVPLWDMLGNSVTPRPGDIIIQFEKSAAAVNFEVTIRYYSMP